MGPKKSALNYQKWPNCHQYCHLNHQKCPLSQQKCPLIFWPFSQKNKCFFSQKKCSFSPKKVPFSSLLSADCPPLFFLSGGQRKVPPYDQKLPNCHQYCHLSHQKCPSQQKCRCLDLRVFLFLLTTGPVCWKLPPTLIRSRMTPKSTVNHRVASRRHTFGRVVIDSGSSVVVVCYFWS